MLHGMSSTIEQLQKLADELTEVSPPPIQPIGLNGALPHSGKWIVVKVGLGLYAVRPEYEDGLGGVIVGKHNDEVKGFAQVVMTALRFAISISSASRHRWSPAPSPFQ